ncbi:MAG: prepilin-type N-terminal cleavage/methylation domain-containing protein, partial [Gammaproteobacteria bacterium]|nr:prepilin-type N-terminal cleavage/methylation domain-containing protein [Gammaproteobacteria bacterium]
MAHSNPSCSSTPIGSEVLMHPDTGYRDARNSNGFTLVEVLMSISLLAVALTLL